MNDEFWTNFIYNFWQRENAQGYKEVEGKGGYSNGKYHPYVTSTGSIDIGPGFDLEFQSDAFKKKAYTEGFTKQELNDSVKQSLQKEIPVFNSRIIKEGGNPWDVSDDVYAGLLDMYWQRHNGLYKEFPKFWKAVASQDYEGMRNESRMTYGKDKKVDMGRWNFRKSTF